MSQTPGTSFCKNYSCCTWSATTAFLRKGPATGTGWILRNCLFQDRALPGQQPPLQPCPATTRVPKRRVLRGGTAAGSAGAGFGHRYLQGNRSTPVLREGIKRRTRTEPERNGNAKLFSKGRRTLCFVLQRQKSGWGCRGVVEGYNDRIYGTCLGGGSGVQAQPKAFLAGTACRAVHTQSWHTNVPRDSPKPEDCSTFKIK